MLSRLHMQSAISSHEIQSRNLETSKSLTLLYPDFSIILNMTFVPPEACCTKPVSVFTQVSLSRLSFL